MNTLISDIISDILMIIGTVIAGLSIHFFLNYNAPIGFFIGVWLVYYGGALNVSGSDREAMIAKIKLPLWDKTRNIIREITSNQPKETNIRILRNRNQSGEKQERIQG